MIIFFCCLQVSPWPSDVKRFHQGLLEAEQAAMQVGIIIISADRTHGWAQDGLCKMSCVLSSMAGCMHGARHESLACYRREHDQILQLEKPPSHVAAIAHTWVDNPAAPDASVPSRSMAGIMQRAKHAKVCLCAGCILGRADHPVGHRPAQSPGVQHPAGLALCRG